VRIEVLCTGDELLTGLTADTNSPYFMGKLMALGEKVELAQCVPDDRAAITLALREAASRADAVLVSGGLGPTADGCTAGCAAAAAGVPLREDAEVLARLKQRFAKRGLEFTPNNAQQARVPEGAEVVHNPVGSAPMFILKLGRCTMFFVPGVPREYRALVDLEVLPRLTRAIQAQPGRKFRRLKVLRTVGLAESHLDAMVAPLAGLHPDITFGFRTQGAENQLKLLAVADTQERVDQAVQAAEIACRAVLGESIYGEDDLTLAEAIAQLLLEKGATLALAESCTGGALADVLTGVAGASHWLWGGGVTYAEAAKTRLADVPDTLIQHEGVVSAAVAGRMAEGIRKVAGTTWGLSTTGFLGPGGGTGTEPVGAVYLGLAGPEGVRTQRHVFGGDRLRVKQFATIYALEFLRRTVRETR